MTARTRAPFRADHVGSLLRLVELVEARAKAKRGEISAEAFRAIEDACIREAVQMQVYVGLRAVTDGEFRRDFWHFDFQAGFNGVEMRDETFGTRFSNGLPIGSTYVSGKVAYPTGGIMADHVQFLLSVATATPKFYAPAPPLFHFRADRAGDFSPLRFLPSDKIVVLGFVTTKQPELESKDDLKRRIEEAAQYVSLDRLCLSPQCGFASSHHGNKLTHDDQLRNLERAVEVADEVWGSN